MLFTNCGATILMPNLKWQTLEFFVSYAEVHQLPPISLVLALNLPPRPSWCPHHIGRVEYRLWPSRLHEEGRAPITIPTIKSVVAAFLSPSRFFFFYYDTVKLRPNACGCWGSNLLKCLFTCAMFNQENRGLSHQGDQDSAHRLAITGLTLGRSLSFLKPSSSPPYLTKWLWKWNEIKEEAGSER